MTRPVVAAALGAAALALLVPAVSGRTASSAGPRSGAASQAAGPPAAAAGVEAAYRANNIGVAYLEQYKHDEAARSFRRALELDPSLTLAKINLAIALFYIPDLLEAAQAAEAAAAAAPDAAQPPYILGLIAKSDNRVDDAMAAFERVLTIDPSDLGARVNLAQLRMQKREYQAAVDLLRPAVAAEPYHVTALYNLGVALTRAGKADEGRQVMEQFQALREGGYGTTFSNNYLEQGRYAEAVASTGAEPGLVAQTADLRFTRAATLPRAAADPAMNPDPAHTRAIAGLGGGLTLVDFDRDGDLDLAEVSGFTVRLLRNDRGTFSDVTAAAGPIQVAPRGAPVAVVAGDYDNDGKPDLFVIGVGVHRLLRQVDGGRFEDVTATAGVPAAQGLHRAAAFVDADHDGDVDLVLAATAGAATHQLLRNNGDGTFADVSTASKLPAVAPGVLALVPTDYDNRRDVDLLLAGRTGAPALLKNLRDGSFRDVSADVGLTAVGASTTVAAGDVNKDGYTDFFFGRAGRPGVFAASNGRSGFNLAELPDLADLSAAQFIDVDNDGLLDLVAAGSAGLVVKRALGQTRSGDATTAAWADSTPLAIEGVPAADLSGLATFASGDVDLDGDTDLLVRTRGGDVVLLRNETGPRHASIAVRLDGRVSNRSAIGSKIEMRAGSLRQKLETASAWPAAAPADVLFGLGTRPSADVVRVLWPAGILQAELPEAPAGASGTTAVQRLTLEELDRKPSSCPYLFTWNGERFEFVTDFLGGGEMGYVHAPGVLNTPDPEEYTRITAAQLRARDGRYELRVTNELEEALFLDRLELLVADHPADVDLYPREGLVSPPFPGFEIYAAANVRPVARALDARGRDVTARTRDLDRRFVDDLPLERIRGYARPHTLTLDLGAPAAADERTLLLLTGWTDYAFSSDNIAAHQAGLTLTPPALQVRDASGAWRTVMAEIGVPVGRPQTVVVDLTNRFLSASREVRLTTSMRIYWDRISVASARADVAPRVTRLEAARADLRWRGFSAEVSPDGREPYGYDYDRVSPLSPWKLLPGRYTREGDVRALLGRVDDFFVVSRPGDEVAVSFDASAVPALPHGWTRTYLLHSVGYSKEMDRNSASPDQASPLPFRTMTRYPYAAPERYPDTPAHRDYLDRWNTRVVGRSLPPIELLSPSSADLGSDDPASASAPAPSAAPAPAPAGDDISAHRGRRHPDGGVR